MGKAKVAITLDENIVRHLDYLVGQRAFKNRSQVIQEAVAEKLERLSRGRLARECAHLDPVAEQELAEEGLAEDVKTWPEY
ncbi:MAG: ribbon-helix-helix domain-containing protein [Gemmatimonadaceae bacterium]|nr:ribbon-helix-helix domain-containing protein [Gemmatimonadaceae bacterium]